LAAFNLQAAKKSNLKKVAEIKGQVTIWKQDFYNLIRNIELVSHKRPCANVKSAKTAAAEVDMWILHTL
jgi:hypothetical protein